MGVYNIAIMRHRTRAWIAPAAALVSLASTTAARTVPISSHPLQVPDALNATLTAVPGVKVGHHTLTERPTGCTVVLVESGATAGVDVRRAAPATRDTDLLSPSKMVQQIFGVALSGGSLFGLSTVDGVLRHF